MTNEFCATQCVEVGDGSCTDFEDSKHPRIWCKSHCHGGMVGVKLVPATDDNAVPCVYHGTDKKRTEEETESLCKGCIMNKRGMCVAGKDGGKCHKMCFPEVGPTQILQPSGDKDSHYANMCLDITIPTNVPMLSVKVAFEFSENKDLECNELAMENKLAMEGEVKEGFTPRRCRHGFEATVGIGLQVDFVVGAVELYFLGALSFESKTTIPCLPWALRAKNQFMKEAFCKPHASSKTKQTDIVMCLKRKTKEECTKPGPESDKPCEWSKVPGYWSCGTGGMLKHFVKSFVTNKLKKGGPEFDAQLVKAQLDKEADSYEEMDQDEIDAVVKFASDVGQEVREARFRKAVALSQAGKQHREKREKNCAAAAAVEKECNALTYLELCLKQKQGDAAETCSYLKKSGRAPGTKVRHHQCHLCSETLAQISQHILSFRLGHLFIPILSLYRNRRSHNSAYPPENRCGLQVETDVKCCPPLRCQRPPPDPGRAFPPAAAPPLSIWQGSLSPPAPPHFEHLRAFEVSKQ